MSSLHASSDVGCMQSPRRYSTVSDVVVGLSVDATITVGVSITSSYATSVPLAPPHEPVNTEVPGVNAPVALASWSRVTIRPGPHAAGLVTYSSSSAADAQP